MVVSENYVDLCELTYGTPGETSKMARLSYLDLVVIEKAV